MTSQTLNIYLAIRYSGYKIKLPLVFKVVRHLFQVCILITQISNRDLNGFCIQLRFPPRPKSKTSQALQDEHSISAN